MTLRLPLLLASVLLTFPHAGCLLFSQVGDDRDAGTLEPTPDAGSDRDGGDISDAGEVDAGATTDAGGNDDAGEVDAGEVDAGEVDAGEVDAGAVDAGAVDAGAVDAGEVDAGEVDAGEVDAGEVDAGMPVFTVGSFMVTPENAVSLDGDSLFLSIQGENLNLVSSFDCPGASVIFSNTGDGQAITGTITIDNVDALLANNVYEDVISFACTITGAGGSSDETANAVEVHRSHGPFVEPNVVTAGGICGHPQRPCSTIVEAATFFRIRLDNAVETRWKDTRYLRLAETTAKEHEISPSSTTQIAISDLGLRGGFAVPFDLTNTDWVLAGSGNSRSEVRLIGGASLLLNHRATPDSDALSRVLSNLNVVGEPTPMTDYSAIIIRRDIEFQNMDVTGMAYSGADPLTIGAQIDAVDIKTVGSLTASDDVTIIGFLSSSGIVSQAPVGGEVSAIRTAGTLNFDGVAIGADRIDALTFDSDTTAATTGIRVENGTATISGSTRGGIAPRPIGILIRRGTLNTTPTTLAEGGVSTVGTLGTNSGRHAVGLLIVGDPNVDNLMGQFVGGQAPDFVAGVNASISGGSFSIADATLRSHLLEEAGSNEARGLRLTYTGLGAFEVAVSALEIDASGIDTTVALRLDATVGNLSMIEGGGAIPILIKMFPLSNRGGHKGVQIKTGSALRADLDIEVVADAADSVSGIVTTGEFTGGVNIDLRSGSGTIAADAVVGIRCGDLNLNPNGQINIGQAELNITGFQSTDSSISAEGGANSAHGVRVVLGCDATIADAKVTVSSEKLATGVTVRYANVELTNTSVDVRGDSTVTAVKMECWTEAHFIANASTFITRGNSLVPTNAHGLTMTNANDVSACTSELIDISNSSFVIDTATTSNSGITTQTTTTAGLTPVIRLSDVTIAVDEAQQSYGINLDVTKALVLLNANDIQVGQSIAGTNTVVGARLSVAAPPDEVQLWNNFIHVEDVSRGTGMLIDILSGANGTLPIYLAHNTIASGTNNSSAGLKATSVVGSGSTIWNAATLLGNTLVGTNSGTALVEQCTPSGQFQRASTAFSGTGNFLSAAGVLSYYSAPNLVCTAVLHSIPGRLAATSTGLLTLTPDTGCNATLPFTTNEDDMAIGGGSLSVGFVWEDYEHVGRPAGGRAGRCR